MRVIRVLTLAVLGILFSNLPLPAQPPSAIPSSDRYLFIVDTSSGMRPRSTAMQKAVNSLLLSGMNAQLQKGDSIGVWTYNEKLRAGRLPVQYWSPETEQVVASNVVSFLKAEHFEKSPRIAAVLSELQSLIKESERLTVLLISDGSEPVAGTPYDANINEFFKENAWKQKQKRMPFITVLRSYRGEYVGMTLNLAPWPVTFPAFPPKPKVAATPKPKTPEPTAKPAAPPPTAPPLIVIGTKPEPEPTSPPAEVTPAAPTPTAASEGGVTPAATPSDKPANPAQPAGSSQSSPPTSAAPAPAPPAQAAEAKPAQPQPATTESQPAATPAQVATSTQPDDISKPKTVLIICVGLLILVVALLLIAQRRTRTATGTSLITRSMDKDE